MQNYKEINGNDYVKDSRTTINETMQSIQSMNSGTAFPTNNLFEGMKCYRTDLKKTYTLTDVENGTWVEDSHATLADEATHAASATKLATPRTLSLSGKAAGSTTFDGAANASINVTSVNADTASKLSTARKINITGNATGSTAFDGSGDVSINTTVNESKHAVNADVAKTLETTDANGVKSNATLYWVGKDGQPMWLWGSNTKPSETYVYNPSNFHVAYADNATNAATATTVNATAPNGGATDLVFGIMANDDSARIRIGGSSDNGWLEIATSDNGNEPIYARQYSGSFLQDGAKSITNEAVLLDGNGNTKFPHDVTAASFTGPLKGNADTASKLNTVGGGTTTFNWVGKAGQPNWLWGGNNSAPTEQYVYDPSNFHVASANTATSATTAGNVSNKIYYSADSPSVATDKLFTVKQAHAGEDNVPNNGLVIQTGPTGANYNGKLYITDNGNDGVWIGGVAGGKEVGWTRLVENKGTWGISISGNAASATNADKLDGYHASDIINRISAANTGGIVAASLTENGYVKFANGLILQWGFVTNTRSAAHYDITFPITFASKCFGVHSTFFRPSGDSDGSGDVQFDTVAHITTKGCQLCADNQSIFWTAIGV